jgi:hypothetical protein
LRLGAPADPATTTSPLISPAAAPLRDLGSRPDRRLECLRSVFVLGSDPAALVRWRQPESSDFVGSNHGYLRRPGARPLAGRWTPQRARRCTTLMKIQFEFSPADVADTAQRIADRSKTARDSRWHAAACWSALLSLALYSFLDGSFIARALFAGLFFIVGFYVYSRLWRQSPRRTYLKYYRLTAPTLLSTPGSAHRTTKLVWRIACPPRSVTPLTPDPLLGISTNPPKCENARGACAPSTCSTPAFLS